MKLIDHHQSIHNNNNNNKNNESNYQQHQQHQHHAHNKNSQEDLANGMFTASMILSSSRGSAANSDNNGGGTPRDDLHAEDEEEIARVLQEKGVQLDAPRNDGNEQQDTDVFAYIRHRMDDKQDNAFFLTRYRQIVGAANPFKEGDLTIGVAARNDESRTVARTLLGRTTIGALRAHALHPDGITQLIDASCANHTTLQNVQTDDMTLHELKTFLLEQAADEIHTLMPALPSDVIACVVKLMSNDELTHMGRKVFNPLPGSHIGAPGYMSARIQPNSPTDCPQDIFWQVLDAFAYAVGDLVLGTNPVSSEPESVAAIKRTLHDILVTLGIDDYLSHCVLSHIDVQARAEQDYLENNNNTTNKNQAETADADVPRSSIWFQSIAGTEAANKTFDVTIDKMQQHLQHQQCQQFATTPHDETGKTVKKNKRYALYGETGQGADFTNGHGAGFDMVVHEARKYGFLRALKQQQHNADQWIHVNDVAGFIGPEVFKTKEQLVRCCLEDTVMGKLHGLTIGLDICSTLHMDVTLDDLDWCIEHVMPANPGYLMALPTKNDPMLSYLTTSFADHVRVREKFGYKINDDMWKFFQRLGIIDPNTNKPTKHFGQPLWVYYQYRRAKGDTRSQEEIYAEGRQQISQVEGRGVPIAQGYGENYWDPPPSLDQDIRRLYHDAKESLWTELTEDAVQAIPTALPLCTQSKNRKDYVYHPESGEELSAQSVQALAQIRQSWQDLPPDQVPNVQVVISDGLNVKSLTDEGHLLPFLSTLYEHLKSDGLIVAPRNLVITYGRVRAGYMVGEHLFGDKDDKNNNKPKGIVHIIGERPGTLHHNFSVYLTAQPASVWGTSRAVDHHVTRVVSGISDTAYHPTEAATEAAKIFRGMRLEHTQKSG